MTCNYKAARLILIVSYLFVVYAILPVPQMWLTLFKNFLTNLSDWDVT